VIKRREYLYPALVALLGAGLGLLIAKSGTNGSELTYRVELGKDYYVGVSLVELSETDSEGESWDSYNKSGPDIVVEIHWKGNRIYRSTKKEDSFIAHWSETELDLRNVALSGTGTSADSLIQAARLNIREGEDIEVKVFDADLVDDEFVGSKIFETADLVLGERSYNYEGPGIKRISLRVKELGQIE